MTTVGFVAHPLIEIEQSPPTRANNDFVHGSVEGNMTFLYVVGRAKTNVGDFYQVCENYNWQLQVVLYRDRR